MGGELVDLLEAAQEAAIEAGGVLGRGGFESQDVVGRGVERLREADDQGAVQAQIAALVLRDERLMEPEAAGELHLAEAAALPNLL